MTGLSAQTSRTLAQLRAALDVPGLAPRVAQNCERLVDRLSKPVRVGLFGFSLSDRVALMRALLGIDLLSGPQEWPTLQVVHADIPRTVATLADASRVTAQGLPDADLLAMGPVFLRVEAPVEVLRRLSLLFLSAGDEVTEQAPALLWASKRTDVAIWCTREFGPIEQQVWAAAPDRLKNHAHLAVLATGGGPEADVAALRERAVEDFDSVVAVPHRTGGFDPAALLARLTEDIETALGEDIDAAQLLLHRFGLAEAEGPVDPPADDGDAAAATVADPVVKPLPAAVPSAADPVAAADRIAILSEPILYLKRRTRNLFETLEWQDDSTEGWVSDLLEHCCETADGLRDRAAGWPEDDAEIIDLRDMVEEASDMAVLLQVEGGRDEAQDAAAMLCQLRAAFEAKLPTLPMAC